MRTGVKICGIRRPQDVEILNKVIPDCAGFVFLKTSARYVSPSEAQALCAKLSPKIRRVGVFVNEPISSVIETATQTGLQVIQLHGDEDYSYVRAIRKRWSGYLWRAVRVQSASCIRAAERLPIDLLVLDAFSAAAYGGTGNLANLSIIEQHRPNLPFFIAGGIDAGNVAEIVRRIQPTGVDLSSGIETDGVKDAIKAEQFMRQIRGIL